MRSIQIENKNQERIVRIIILIQNLIKNCNQMKNIGKMIQLKLKIKMMKLIKSKKLITNHLYVIKIKIKIRNHK